MTFPGKANARLDHKLSGGESLLIPPYGDELVDLIVPPGEARDLREYASGLPSLQLSERSVCDLEMLATGAFSPLDRFMGRENHRRVLEEMRLESGHIFPIPVTLPVEPGPELHLDREVALRDTRNELLAVMTVEEVYEWDRTEVAQKVFGTQDLRHPLVAELSRWRPVNLSGRLKVLQLPRHYDFQELRLTPAETRAGLEAFRNTNVVAFQTRNPLHRAHEELSKRAREQVDGVLLLHPVVGMTKPGDIDHYTRVRTYKAMASRYYDPDRIFLALLPLAMRLAGPREALWHAVIRRNYGANFLIVGRDHASPGVGATGEPFYGAHEAQELIEEFRDELGVGVLKFRELVYLPEEKRYEEAFILPGHASIISIAGSEIREEYLRNGMVLPPWYARPEVVEILAEAYPPMHKRGVCVWFTGLSGAGKSTTAEVLTAILMEHGRRVTLLDGDVVRTHLSKGLGFTKEDRDANVRRIGFVASEIARHGGVAVCAAVSPYQLTRNDVRNMVGADHFVEVYVDTPLEVCERRDSKGLYAKARKREITHFTGIDDPYEPPEHPEIVLDTIAHTPEENAHLIIDDLITRGFVQGDLSQPDFPGDGKSQDSCG